MAGLYFRLKKRSAGHRTAVMTALALLALFFSIGFVACGGGGSDGDDDTPNAQATTNYNEVFTDGVRELTPNVATSAVVNWDGWSADGASEHEYSVLNKLFNPDSGWESVFGPVDEAEMILNILETYSETLAVNGTYDISPGDGLTYATTVSDVDGDFQVPFFNVTQSGLLKQVVIEASDDSNRIMVAYDMEGDDKAMVVHMIHDQSGDEGTSYMVFHAVFNETTQVLHIQAAAVADKDDNFKLAFIWDGDLDAETFSITQYTNAAKDDIDNDGIFETDGFWQVMGGGSLAGEMAFRAVTNDSPSDDYFVVVTMDDILSATAPDGYPAASSTIDSATYPVQGYIDVDHANCLGWLTSFPEVDDLDDWTY